MRSVWPKTCICLITIKRNKREKDTHTHAHTLTPNERTKKNSFSVEHFERRIERRRLKLTKSEIIPFFLLCLCFFYFLAIAHSLTLTIFLSSRLSGGNQIFVNLALSMLETKELVRICFVMESTFWNSFGFGTFSFYVLHEHIPKNVPIYNIDYTNCLILSKHRC